MHAIVALAGTLQIDTIANGIESTALMEALTTIEMRFLEGAIFGDPIDGDVVAAELGAGLGTIEPGDNRARRARRTAFCKIQEIHDDDAFEVMLRNRSKTDVLGDVPGRTQLMVDPCVAKLSGATLTRSSGTQKGWSITSRWWTMDRAGCPPPIACRPMPWSQPLRRWPR